MPTYKKIIKTRVISEPVKKAREVIAPEIRRATSSEKELIKASPRKRRKGATMSDAEVEARAKKRAERAEKRAQKQAAREAKQAVAEGKKPRKAPRAACPFDIGSLTVEQIGVAADRVILGERVATVAKDFGVSPTQLADKIKDWCGTAYMRAWQQSVNYDCLRAELLLNKSLKGALDADNVAWGSLALKILEYRAKVLGFATVNPQDQTPRVAGLSRDDVFDKILSFV